MEFITLRDEYIQPERISHEQWSHLYLHEPCSFAHEPCRFTGSLDQRKKGEVTDSALRVIRRELQVEKNLSKPESVSLVCNEHIRKNAPVVCTERDSLQGVFDQWQTYGSYRLSASETLALYVSLIENPYLSETIGKTAVFFLTRVLVDPMVSRCGMYVAPTGNNEGLVLDTWGVMNPLNPYNKAMWIVGDYLKPIRKT